MWASNYELIRHIQSELQFCRESIKHVSEDSFYQNEILKRAIVRSIEIIGEASKKLNPDFKIEHAHIPWKKMAGMRDVLIHDYMGVDYELVWEVVFRHLPEMESAIQDLLPKE